MAQGENEIKVGLVLDKSALESLRKDVGRALNDLSLGVSTESLNKLNDKIKSNVNPKISLSINQSSLRGWASEISEKVGPVSIKISADTSKIATQISKDLSKTPINIELKLDSGQVGQFSRLTDQMAAQFDKIGAAKDRFAANVEQKFPKITSLVAETNAELVKMIALLKEAKVGDVGQVSKITSKSNRATETQDTRENAPIKITKEVKKELKELTNELKVSERANKQVTKALAEQKEKADALAKTHADLRARIKAASDETKSFGERVGYSAARFTAYLIPAAAIFKISQGFSMASSAVVTLSEDINKLGQVLDHGQAKAEKFAETLLKTTANYGASSKSVLATAQQLATNPKFNDPNEIKRIAKMVAQTNVVAGFGSAQETTEGLLSVIGQFNMTASDTPHILDALTEGYKKAGISANSFFEAVKTGGAVARQAGFSFDQYQAVINTIAQRSTLSGGEITASLNAGIEKSFNPETQFAVEKITGKSVRDSNGQLKPYLQQATEVALAAKRKGQQLPDVLRSFMDQRQAKTMIPLFEDLQGADTGTSKILNNMKDIDKSAGSFQNSVAQGVESINTQLASITERFNAAFAVLGNDKGLQKLVKDFADIAKWSASAVEEVAPLIPLIVKLGTVIGAIAVFNNFKPFIRGAQSFIFGSKFGGMNGPQTTGLGPNPFSPTNPTGSNGGISPQTISQIAANTTKQVLPTSTIGNFGIFPRQASKESAALLNLEMKSKLYQEQKLAQEIASAQQEKINRRVSLPIYSEKYGPLNQYGSWQQPASKENIDNPSFFRTGQGSVYAYGNQQSTRIKSLHQAHDQKDVGLKDQSDITYFSNEEDSRKMGMWQTLSSSGKRIVKRDNELLLTSINPKTGKRGIDDRVSILSEIPQIGLHPIELSHKTQEGWWSGSHPGSSITEIGHMTPEIQQMFIDAQLAQNNKFVPPKKVSVRARSGLRDASILKDIGSPPSGPSQAYVDSAWARLQKGKKIAGYTKADTLESHIQAMVERGFIKSPEDLKRYAEDFYQQKIAQNPSISSSFATPPSPLSLQTSFSSVKDLMGAFQAQGGVTHPALNSYIDTIWNKVQKNGTLAGSGKAGLEQELQSAINNNQFKSKEDIRNFLNQHNNRDEVAKVIQDNLNRQNAAQKGLRTKFANRISDPIGSLDINQPDGLNPSRSMSRSMRLRDRVDRTPSAFSDSFKNAQIYGGTLDYQQRLDQEAFQEGTTLQEPDYKIKAFGGQSRLWKPVQRVGKVLNQLGRFGTTTGSSIYYKNEDITNAVGGAYDALSYVASGPTRKPYHNKVVLSQNRIQTGELTKEETQLELQRLAGNKKPISESYKIGNALGDIYEEKTALQSAIKDIVLEYKTLSKGLSEEMKASGVVSEEMLSLARIYQTTKGKLTTLEAAQQELTVAYQEHATAEIKATLETNINTISMPRNRMFSGVGNFIGKNKGAIGNTGVGVMLLASAGADFIGNNYLNNQERLVDQDGNLRSDAAESSQRNMTNRSKGGIWNDIGSGMGMGGMAGMTIGPWGMVAGGVIGGLAGLGYGVLNSSQQAAKETQQDLLNAASQGTDKQSASAKFLALNNMLDNPPIRWDMSGEDKYQILGNDKAGVINPIQLSEQYTEHLKTDPGQAILERTKQEAFSIASSLNKNDFKGDDPSDIIRQKMIQKRAKEFEEANKSEVEKDPNRRLLIDAQAVISVDSEFKELQRTIPGLGVEFLKITTDSEKSRNAETKAISETIEKFSHLGHTLDEFDFHFQNMLKDIAAKTSQNIVSNQLSNQVTGDLFGKTELYQIPEGTATAINDKIQAQLRASSEGNSIDVNRNLDIIQKNTGNLFIKDQQDVFADVSAVEQFQERVGLQVSRLMGNKTFEKTELATGSTLSKYLDDYSNLKIDKKALDLKTPYGNDILDRFRKDVLDRAYQNPHDMVAAIDTYKASLKQDAGGKGTIEAGLSTIIANKNSEGLVLNQQLMRDKLLAGNKLQLSAQGVSVGLSQLQGLGTIGATPQQLLSSLQGIQTGYDPNNLPNATSKLNQSRQFLIEAEESSRKGDSLAMVLDDPTRKLATVNLIKAEIDETKARQESTNEINKNKIALENLNKIISTFQNASKTSGALGFQGRAQASMQFGMFNSQFGGIEKFLAEHGITNANSLGKLSIQEMKDLEGKVGMLSDFGLTSLNSARNNFGGTQVKGAPLGATIADYTDIIQEIGGNNYNRSVGQGLSIEQEDDLYKSREGAALKGPNIEQQLLTSQESLANGQTKILGDINTFLHDRFGTTETNTLNTKYSVDEKGAVSLTPPETPKFSGYSQDQFKQLHDKYNDAVHQSVELDGSGLTGYYDKENHYHSGGTAKGVEKESIDRLDQSLDNYKHGTYEAVKDKTGKTEVKFDANLNVTGFDAVGKDAAAKAIVGKILEHFVNVLDSNNPSEAQLKMKFGQALKIMNDAANEKK